MTDETQNETSHEEPSDNTPSEQTTEAPAAPAQPDTSWVPKRISEITAARRAAEARATDLEAELHRLKAGQTTEPGEYSAPSQNVEQLARAYAERMVRDQTEVSTLNQRIASINQAGAKEFGDEFDKSIQNLQLAGVGGQDFLNVIANVPKAEAVITWLGKTENLNEAMRITTLGPVRMGIELTELSRKASKELGKQISKAPAPIETIEGRSGSDGREPDASDTKAWLEWRNKTRKTKR